MQSYKDLHPAMKQFITGRLMWSAVLTAVLFLFFTLIFDFKIGAVVLLAGIAYILYTLLLLLSFLMGRGDMYEGVVIQDTEPIDSKRSRLKDGARLISNHTVFNTLRFRTLADEKIIEIRFKGKEQFKTGNKITVFTPSNAAIRKAEDLYLINDYYKVVKDFEDIDDYIRSLENESNTEPFAEASDVHD